MDRPKLLLHYYVQLQPGTQGEDTLLFRSTRRTVTIQGKHLAGFVESVMPLLDGEHTLAQIHDATASLFSFDSLNECLKLLANERLLAESTDIPRDEVRQPQWNFCHELGASAAEVRGKLAGSRVAVIGGSGPSAEVCMRLAAAGVGEIRIVDPWPAGPSFDYFAPCPTGSPETRVERYTAPIESDDGLAQAIAGSHFAICCVDAGLIAIAYRLNRVANASGMPWTSATMAGFEAIAGPTVFPYRTACYLCYRMRSIACTDAPPEQFAFEKMLDQRRTDDSGVRENLTFAAGIAGNMAALEAFYVLTGVNPSILRGRIAVVDLLTLSTTKHTILRKPGCPVCGVQ